MGALERHRGHFYNWYDTQRLQPLLPMYVSTVDSGNLAAHLLTLRAGLLALPDEPILSRPGVRRPGRHAGRPRESQAGDVPPRSSELQRELDAAIAAGGHDGQRREATPRPAGRAGRRARIDRQRPAVAATRIDTGPSRTGPVPARPVPGSRMRNSRSWLRWTSLAAPPAGLEGLLPQAQVPSLREIAGFEGGCCRHIERELAATAANRRARGFTRAPDRHRRWQRARAAGYRQHRAARPPGQRLRVARLRLPLRQEPSPAGDRLQPDRAAPDPSHYDLLASEARLSIFVAIAQGQLPQESWFALGRLLTRAGGDPCWSRGAARCSST
jgi:cyclic beta-1,2-glucan synthetase